MRKKLSSGKSRRFAGVFVASVLMVALLLWAVPALAATGGYYNGSANYDPAGGYEAGGSMTAAASFGGQSENPSARMVSGSSGVVTPTANVLPITVSVDSSPISDAFSFDKATEGYGAPEPVVFTITNIGTEELTGLTVALESAAEDNGALSVAPRAAAANSPYFVVEGPDDESLQAGGETEFTIVPVTGLMAADSPFTDLVIIEDAALGTYEFEISFVVNDAVVVPAPAIKIKSAGLDSLRVGQAVSGAGVVFTLSNGTYAAAVNAADFAVSGLPAGLAAGNAVRTSDTVVTVPVNGTPTTATAFSIKLTLPASIPMVNITGATANVVPKGKASASAVERGAGATVSGAPALSGTPTQTSFSVSHVTNAGATGQSVEYAISTNGTTTPATGWQAGTTFTGLNSNTAYFVFARTAANANFNAGPAQVSAAIFTAAPTIPTVPQNFIATPGVGQATLTWADPANDGGSAIIAYQVSRNGGTSWILLDAVNTHTFTGLTADTQLTFMVRAINGVGVGPAATATATPAAPPPQNGDTTAPDAPHTSMVTADDGSVPVDFTREGSIVTLDLNHDVIDEILGGASGSAFDLDMSRLTGITKAIIPAKAFSRFSGAGLAMDVIMPQGTLLFDADAMASIAGQIGTGDVSLRLEQVDLSTLAPQKVYALGDGDVVFSIVLASGEETISNFEGTLTATLPYSGPMPAAVWYLDSEGNLDRMENVYDEAANTVTFVTNHLSYYAVGPDTEAMGGGAVDDGAAVAPGVPAHTGGNAVLWVVVLCAAAVASVFVVRYVKGRRAY